MKLGKLYGVGVGPGEPDLITLKALKTLQKSDMIFYVVSRQSESSVSGNVIDKMENISAECVKLVFAMKVDKNDREALVKENAERILEELRKGKNCSFATIGDPLTYSTFGYIMKEILSEEPDVEMEIIPGINSWSALASKKSKIMVEDKEVLSIVPCFEEKDVEQYVNESDTNVFLKVFRQKNNVVEQLRDLNVDILYGANIGLENEFISDDPDEIIEQDNHYLSMIIAKRKV